MTKYCKDCVYLTFMQDGRLRCSNHALTGMDIVTGKPATADAYFMRKKHGKCGIKASGFEEKKSE